MAEEKEKSVVSELPVYSAAGKKTGSIAAPAEIFAVKVTKSLLHQVVRWQRAKVRAGSHNTLTRTEVSGGGAKPWRQKGTGRARAGSNTSPLWVGGGVAHGPKQRSYDFKLNIKQKAKALTSASSARAAEGNVLVVEDFGISEIKTKQAAKFLNLLGIASGERAVVVIDDKNAVLAKSLRNIDGVTVLGTKALNVYDILVSKYFVIQKSELERVQARFVN